MLKITVLIIFQKINSGLQGIYLAELNNYCHPTNGLNLFQMVSNFQIGLQVAVAALNDLKLQLRTDKSTQMKWQEKINHE